MIRPLCAMGDGRTRVLLAVLDGCRGNRSIGRAAGLSSPDKHLHALRDLGLIAFEDRRQNTMRARVRPVVWGDLKGKEAHG